MNDEKVILLFDGYCNLCNSSVNFVLKHDRKNRFRFAALQSQPGIALLKQYTIIPGITDSVVVIEQGKAYLRSSAGLRIAANLGFPWNSALVLYIIPAFLRNPVYDFIARNRYRWYGKRDTCRLPDAAEKAKFLT